MMRIRDEEVAGLLKAESRQLIGFILMLTGERDSADDIFQETCLEAWRHRSRFSCGRDFGAWLRGIARNLVRRQRRSLARSQARSLPLRTSLIDQLEASWARACEDGLEDARRAALLGCLEQLDEPQRQLLHRRYGEGASHGMIAGDLGRSTNAVKMLFHRLRRALFRCVSTRLQREEIDAL